MKRLAFVACLVALAALRVTAQTPAPQAPAQFRAGVDLMRIDVTVLDKRTRRPITGLRAEDFEVKVGGNTQPIQAVAEASHRASGAATDSWQSTAGRDVVSNSSTATRLIVIVMDDAGGGLWHRPAGKKVAHKIIDGLGPEDLAAVVFVKRTQFSQDFTSDRGLLRAAVETFDPESHARFASPSPIGTIRNVRNFLSSVARYRRAIMVVTSRGYELDTGPSLVWGFLREAALNDKDHDATASPEFEPASRLGHVPVYFFTTFGLTVPTNPQARKVGEDTVTIARFAGGRAIIENNAPETEVPEVMDELGSIYTLAYAPTFVFDGKLRFADVKVNRPDVLVLPSSGAFRTAQDLGDAGSRPGVNVNREFGLLAAVAAPLMEGALPLSLSTTTMAVTGVREQAVAVTLGLPAPDTAEGPQQFRLTMLVYDGEGRRELSKISRVVTVSSAGGTDDSLAEVLLRLDLRPGRYNLRVGAEPAGKGVAGSVFTSITVPDFAGEPLSMSGVAMGWAEGRPIGGREAIQPLLPFAPTVARTFSTTDRVGALVRVHQGGKRPETVTLETQIVDATNVIVASASKTLDASGFAAGTGVEHRYELPLRTLAPGEYLMRFVATAGNRHVNRDVRFSIR